MENREFIVINTSHTVDKKGIYKFEFDCGRMGSLSGSFVALESEVKKIIGTEIYFGEVLGKHSEIYGTVDDNEITFVTNDIEFVRLFEKHKLSTGFNPLNYIDEEN